MKAFLTPVMLGKQRSQMNQSVCYDINRITEWQNLIDVEIDNEEISNGIREQEQDVRQILFKSLIKNISPEAILEALKALVADKVDWYLDELVSEMDVLTGKKVSVPTLWRSLRFCGITRKKLHKNAKERNEILRGAFIANMEINYTPDQLVFLDESAKDEQSLSRGYGYSLINTRARKSVVFVRGKRYTILPALSLQRFIAIDIMEGSCIKERFKDFVISDVLPKMNPYPGPNSVIVLDNAKIHHDEGLIEYLQAFGIRVEFLPPYSPDLNPIETSFSVMKVF
ncbi:unnamed protein product [Rhizophagus irregularis]|nr:unnamed protein product [Rhizophagus irregularis]